MAEIDLLGQLAGLVNKPRHKDEDDKESEEALVAWRGWEWGLRGPSPAVCRTALTHEAALCPSERHSSLLGRSCCGLDNSRSPLLP